MSAITWAVVLLAGLSCALAKGTQTSIEEFPSVVQIEDRVGTLWIQQCVGNVVTNYHILTACSCVPDEYIATRRIRAGASERGVGGVVKYIRKIVHHPSFGIMGRDGDIAMVVLSNALVFDDTVKQAAIAGQGIALPENLQMTLVGWGTTAEGGLVGNDYLYSLNVYTVGEDSCLENYYGQQIITENMICVRQLGSDGLDFDSRDAGGPIIYGGTTFGINSFGVSRGNDAYPVGATAISSYTDWILEQASIL